MALTPEASARNEDARKVLARVYDSQRGRAGQVVVTLASEDEDAFPGMGRQRLVDAAERLVARSLLKRVGLYAYSIDLRGIDTSEDPDALDAALPVLVSSAASPAPSEGKEKPAQNATKDGELAVNIKNGAILGSWRLDRKLGSGGQGEVWKVSPDKRAPGPPRAMKICTSSDSKARQRFVQEIRLAAANPHAHLVGVVDSNVEPSRERNVDSSAPLYFVMPLGLGALEDPAFTRDTLTVLRLFREACIGIQFLHSQSPPVLHRDIKPSNILVFEEPFRAAVSDFGIATAEDEQGMLTKTNEIVGSRVYRAPEVFHGDAATVRSEVYGLGRVLERILTGQLPDSLSARRVPTHERRLSDAAATQLDAVILKATQLNPSDRFASVEDLLAAMPDLRIEVSPTRADASSLTFASSRIDPTWGDFPFLPGGSIGTYAADLDSEDIEMKWDGPASSPFCYMSISTTGSPKRLSALELRKVVHAGLPLFGAERVGYPHNRWTLRARTWQGVAHATDAPSRAPQATTPRCTIVQNDGTVVGLDADVSLPLVSGRPRIPIIAFEPQVAFDLREFLRFISAHNEMLGLQPPLQVRVGLMSISKSVLALPVDSSRSTSRATMEEGVHHELRVEDLMTPAEELLHPFFADVWGAYEIERDSFLRKR